MSSMSHVSAGAEHWRTVLVESESWTRCERKGRCSDDQLAYLIDPFTLENSPSVRVILNITGFTW